MKAQRVWRGVRTETIAQLVRTLPQKPEDLRISTTHIKTKPVLGLGRQSAVRHLPHSVRTGFRAQNPQKWEELRSQHPWTQEELRSQHPWTREAGVAVFL